MLPVESFVTETCTVPNRYPTALPLLVTEVLVTGGSTGAGSTGAGLAVTAGFGAGFGFVTVEPDVLVPGLFWVGMEGVLGA